MSLVVFSRGSKLLGERAPTPVRGPSGRETCGELGKGTPGRRVRRMAATVRSVKDWARTTDEGRAWLERKRRAS